ncbi:Uncharacterized protein HZ326_1709 [Fusarium oxysporum f. sp. albedinis]|nr:Uncharacterized protein HZ326_1709 [Fusarium oxysporum f. sp. albedinis]
MRVFNGTELRELLISPPGSISFVLSTTSSHLDISASRPCDIPASAPSISPPILLLDIQGRCTLTLTFACSITLPRPTTAALAARTTQTAFGCSTFWALWCPRP